MMSHAELHPSISFSIVLHGGFGQPSACFLQAILMAVNTSVSWNCLGRYAQGHQMHMPKLSTGSPLDFAARNVDSALQSSSSLVTVLGHRHKNISPVSYKMFNMRCQPQRLCIKAKKQSQSDHA